MTLNAPEGEAAPTVVAPPAHVPGLDGARALATLSVFFFHALWRTPALAPLRPVLGHADIGVEVFFILSGFLVTRPLLAHAVLGGRPCRRSTSGGSGSPASGRPTWWPWWGPSSSAWAPSTGRRAG